MRSFKSGNKVSIPACFEKRGTRLSKGFFANHMAMFFALGLTACSSDFTLDPLPSEFQGNWQGICTKTISSGSFLEKWNIKNGRLNNTISLWKQPNCPTNVSAETLKLTAAFLKTSKKGQQVSTVCKNGNALITQTTLTKLSIGNQIITGFNAVRNELESRKINTVLPTYDLICLDNDGKLHTGDLSTGDGSVESKRPTEMDAVKFFTKQ